MFGNQFFYSHNLMTDNNKDQGWPFPEKKSY